MKKSMDVPLETPEREVVDNLDSLRPTLTARVAVGALFPDRISSVGGKEESEQSSEEMWALPRLWPHCP